MPPEGRLTGKLTYRLKLTPQMRLDIHLLQLPLLKLKEYIKQQIEENPLLDIQDLEFQAGARKEPGEYSAYDESKGPAKAIDQEEEEKESYKKSLIAYPATLGEYLSRQLQLHAACETDCKIGESIIGNLDKDGYLRCSVEEITKSAEAEASQVEKVLNLIQTFDPVGVGARNLRECLLLQLNSKGTDETLACQIVDKCLPYLEKKRFNYIAETLKVSIERVKEAVREIRGLEPKPGRSFGAERNAHLMPDAVLKRKNEDYEIEFNFSELPRLTLSKKYRDMIKKKDTPKDAKEYLKERIKAARSLINAVNKREETIQKVVSSIVSMQKEFLDEGIDNLKPLTLDEIADKVGKHKSTVSRAISNKYIQTPWGIVELHYFLSPGIKQKDGEYLSSKAIKAKMSDLIVRERRKKPLSDQEIVRLLRKEGVSVSRRTIAKYRKEFKIPPSKSRR